MPERFNVVCIPCKALYKCSAFFTFHNFIEKLNTSGWGIISSLMPVINLTPVTHDQFYRISSAYFLSEIRTRFYFWICRLIIIVDVSCLCYFWFYVRLYCSSWHLIIIQFGLSFADLLRPKSTLNYYINQQHWDIHRPKLHVITIDNERLNINWLNRLLFARFDSVREINR